MGEKKLKKDKRKLPTKTSPKKIPYLEALLSFALRFLFFPYLLRPLPLSPSSLLPLPLDPSLEGEGFEDSCLLLFYLCKGQ